MRYFHVRSGFRFGIQRRRTYGGYHPRPAVIQNKILVTLIGLKTYAIRPKRFDHYLICLSTKPCLVVNFLYEYKIKKKKNPQKKQGV